MSPSSASGDYARATDGVSSLEYALIASLVALAIVAGVALVGSSLLPGLVTVAGAI